MVPVVLKASPLSTEVYDVRCTVISVWNRVRSTYTLRTVYCIEYQEDYNESYRVSNIHKVLFE